MGTKKWDAVVIGAGPAGASAARTLVSGGMKCLIVEKKNLPREKMCSGILSNWVVDFVHRRFGAIPEKAYCEPPFLDGAALYFPSIDRPVNIDSHTAIPNVWRSHFDNFLAQTSGAEIYDGYTLQNIEIRAGGFTVTCKVARGNKVVRESINAKYVVAADGSNTKAVRIMMPGAEDELPAGVGMQMHYRGEIDIDPKRYHVFFHTGMGFYVWAGIKNDDIHVGSGIMGKRGQKECLNNFINLLKDKYSLKIKKIHRIEGMMGAIKAPVNVFTLGKGNFLAAGDAGGFIHNFGEGISCALTTGDLAGEAILESNKTGEDAIDIYRKIVKDEAMLCLDQFNPLRMLKKTPMPMDFKTFREEYSTREKLAMLKDFRAFSKQNTDGFGATGIGKITKRNMLHYLLRRRYPIEL